MSVGFSPASASAFSAASAMQADLGGSGMEPRSGGLGSADHGDGPGGYIRVSPPGGTAAAVIVLARAAAKATSSGMSRTSASGVCGQSMMLVLIRGSFASFTTAMA